ncbi:Vacuolar protein sorting-associated protein 17 [Coemansia aciculifera]|uniref:Vacuolar protein sorting-associated protein 17 n=1 Tax=Coemansia aciculifera TaxID=417176 RepID=A0A9W8M4T0_9FUNG|nr:Vacuolar protein sorting-associated protein 17 [Coemansia aciculifera]
MFNEDEIDPHRLPQQQQPVASDGMRNSLYSDLINPFSGNEAEQAAPWGPVNQAEAPSSTHSDEDDDDADSIPGRREETSGRQHSQGEYASQSVGDSVPQSNASAKGPRPLLSFTVGQMVDRSKRSPNFTFDVVTNMPNYKARKYTGVERNQIEFERLEAHLRATYPECLVPTLGSGTTVSKYVPDYHNDRLVVLLLQQWLKRVSEHPILQQDYELRQFVEAQFAFNPALTSSTASSSALSMSPHGTSLGGGFFSWGSKNKQRVARSSNPSPFEQELEQTSSNLEVFQKNIGEARRWHGRMARARTRLSGDLREVGTKLVSVGVIEHSAPLSRSFKRLGKCFLTAGSCAMSQANMEGSRAIAVDDIYMVACDYVQKTLNNRQVIFTEHQVAERQLERKRQSVAVLRSSSHISPEQVQETLAEFNVAKSDADNKRQRAERVDRVLAADLRAFETNREGDFRAMFGALARDQLHVERQVLTEFKAVLEFIRHGSSAANSAGKESAPTLAASASIGIAHK